MRIADPDEGEGTCLGFDIIRDAAKIKREVGYMTQRFSYYEDLSIAENLDLSRASMRCRIGVSQSIPHSSVSGLRAGALNLPGRYQEDGSSAWRSRRVFCIRPTFFLPSLLLGLHVSISRHSSA